MHGLPATSDFGKRPIPCEQRRIAGGTVADVTPVRASCGLKALLRGCGLAEPRTDEFQ